MCKLLADTVAEKIGTATKNHRKWFGVNNDLICEELLANIKAHEIFFKNLTHSISNSFTEMRREVQ